MVLILDLVPFGPAMLEIPYVLIQENHPEVYEIHCTGITSDLSYTYKVNDLIQQRQYPFAHIFGPLRVPTNYHLSVQGTPTTQFISPVHVHSLLYSCSDPYPIFRTCLKPSLRWNLGLLIETFCVKKVAPWSPAFPLGPRFLGTNNER